MSVLKLYEYPHPILEQKAERVLKVDDEIRQFLRDMLEKKGYNLFGEYMDCGHFIYSFDEDSYQGGSGAGCSASVLSAYILRKMKEGVYKKVLVIATGALMSTVTNQQGDAIPSVAHLIELIKE